MSVLYLRISQDSLSFAHYDATDEANFKNIVHPLNHAVSLYVNLRNAIVQYELLQQNYSRVEVIVVGKTVAVPLTEFNEEDAIVTYDYCFAQDAPHRVFYDPLPGMDAVLLFALNETTCRAIEEMFHDVHYTSAMTAVVKHCVGKGLSTSNGNRRFAYCHEENLDLICFDNDRLIMLSTYPLKNPDDAVYYILSTASQLGQEPTEGSFYVVGDEPMQSAILKRLSRFAADVRQIRPSSEYNRSNVAQNAQVPYDMVTLLLDSM